MRKRSLDVRASREKRRCAAIQRFFCLIDGREEEPGEEATRMRMSLLALSKRVYAVYRRVRKSDWIGPTCDSFE